MPDVRWFILAVGIESNGFGDSSERGVNPTVWLLPLLIIWRVKRVIPMPDGMPENVGSCCAGMELRLYRMCTEQDYNTTFPARADKMVWYKRRW